jgi:hypothetical protein
MPWRSESTSCCRSSGHERASHLIMVAEIPSSRNRAREARRTHSNTSPVMPMSPVALGIRPGGTLGLRRTLAIPPTSVSMARAQVRARRVRHRGAASHHYQDQHHPDRFGQPHPCAVVSSVSRWKVRQPPAPPVDARWAAACDIPTTRPGCPQAGPLTGTVRWAS